MNYAKLVMLLLVTFFSSLVQADCPAVSELTLENGWWTTSTGWKSWKPKEGTENYQPSFLSEVGIKYFEQVEPSEHIVVCTYSVRKGFIVTYMIQMIEPSTNKKLGITYQDRGAWELSSGLVPTCNAIRGQCGFDYQK